MTGPRAQPSASSRNMPRPSEFAHHWSLDPGMAYLNHGSFGACPIPVLEAQSRWRAQLEREPIVFVMKELEGLLDEARTELASFVGADGNDLAFVPNATTGVNTVLRSLEFSEGNELLTTSHEYNACRNALEFVAGRSGARVVVVDVPFPVESPEAIVEAVADRITPRTRLGLFDHVTSLTGMVMPVRELVALFAERGIDTLVDGAHAPGMVPLSLGELGATYYTGNCHKWLCTPKGAALLYVRRDRQPTIRPLAISHGANADRPERSRFRLEFDWTGTDDPSAYLCVPESIRFMGSLLPGGWPELMQRNRALALEARAHLCSALGVDPPCPDEMIGTLASIPLGRGSYTFTTTALAFDPIEEILRDRYHIEVPVLACPDGPASLIRIACQIYNSIEQYDYLADALLETSREGATGTRPDPSST
jgi:isopenicillin-N epimerase